jgi:hypothetical protein
MGRWLMLKVGERRLQKSKVRVGILEGCRQQHNKRKIGRKMASNNIRYGIQDEFNNIRLVIRRS